MTLTAESQSLLSVFDEAFKDYAEIPNRVDLGDIIRCSGQRVALDTETTGLYWYKDTVIGIGLHCPDAGVSGYFPCRDEDRLSQAISLIRNWDTKTTVIGHNLKFDLLMLGLDPTWQLLDTMVMAHLLDSRRPKALVAVESRYLGAQSKRQILAAAPKTEPRSWTTEQLAVYCHNDATVAFQLAEIQVPLLRKLGLIKLLQQDMRFLEQLIRIERRGILVDAEFLNTAFDVFAEDQAQAEQLFFNALGRQVDWKSPKKLSQALYEGFGWPRPVNPFADEDGVDRTRLATKGKYNSALTDSDILLYKANHPLGPKIVRLREIEKMRSYLTKLLEYRDAEGVLHANFRQTGTITARLSSTAPNLQNLPGAVRGKLAHSQTEADAKRTGAYNIRTALVSRPDRVFGSIDYRQMEMRMFGVIAKEPKMLEALRTGRDVHIEVAELVWGVRDDVHRRWSKTIGFGLLYGMTTRSLQFRLNMTREQAYEVTDQYWGAFPRMKPWIKEVIRTIEHQGYVRYWSGRIWREDNPQRVYRGANALIQGGCADLLVEATLRCQAYLDKHRCGHIVNLVHDEILFEMEERDALEHLTRLAEIMQVSDLFDLPFFTDIKVGCTYGSLEKVQEAPK